VKVNDRERNDFRWRRRSSKSQSPAPCEFSQGEMGNEAERAVVSSHAHQIE